MTPGQAALRLAGEAHDKLGDVIHEAMSEARNCRQRGDCEHCTARYSAALEAGENYARAAIAAQQPQTASDNAEVAYEQWIEHRNPADVGSMAGFTAGWQEAMIAVSGWPRCPNGCGCRLGSEDADARDCACDGLCCYDEIEVSEVFAERDALRRRLAAQPSGGTVTIDGQTFPVATPPAAPGSEASDLRAVINMIWRMCERPREVAGTTQGVVVNGERLAERIAGLIKNSGMEPF